MSGHALYLRDRNAGQRHRAHVHRWAPECSCSWVGRFKRRRREAEEEYREHLPSPAKARSGNQPRPVTPPERLPEALRPAELFDTAPQRAVANVDTGGRL